MDLSRGRLPQLTAQERALRDGSRSIFLTMTPRSLSDFAAMSHYHQTSLESPFYPEKSMFKGDAGWNHYPGGSAVDLTQNGSKEQKNKGWTSDEQRRAAR
jgi:hypothetical protein